MLNTLLVVLLLALNFGISWWNAKSVGWAWTESQVHGGWPRTVAWSAAVMSAAGFTWVYLFLLTITVLLLGKVPPEAAQFAFNLGYVILILPVLGSGLILTIHGWQVAVREKRFLGYGVAGYNTLAQAYNTVRAATLFPKAVENVFKGLAQAKGDAKNRIYLFMVLLVPVTLILGALTTRAIVLSTARSHGQRLMNGRVAHAGTRTS